MRNLSLGWRHIFAICDLRRYTSLRVRDDILSRVPVL